MSENKETTEKKKRIRRTAEQRVEDLNKEIERIQAKKKEDILAEAISGGYISAEHADEYKLLQKATRSIGKVVRLAEEFKRDSLKGELVNFRGTIIERMKELLGSDSEEAAS